MYMFFGIIGSTRESSDNTIIETKPSKITPYHLTPPLQGI